MANASPKKSPMTLTESEKLLFENIQKSNVSEVMRLLNDKETRIDCLDENGMTPLQHAAYRGNESLCRLLLDRGADVNSNFHEHGYTALMFAALSGNTAIASLLLTAGASTTAVNGVKRNAAQMAAFVGNHAFVSVINNFIPNSKVEYYAKIQGLEVEPKLPPNLVTPLHRLLISTNVHPIFVSLYLQRNSGLFDAASKISKVLEMMCERESKSPDPNEVLALKFHFLSYFVKSCSNLAATFQQNPKIKLEGPALLTNVMKYWLKGREEDGFPKALEELVRQGLREYPYHHQSLFQQLVRTLAPVRIGDEPTGIDLVTSTLCGRQMADAEDACSTCGEASMDSRPLRKCSVCKSVQYCGEVCQRLHWPGHKKQCPSLAKKTQKINADEKKCKFDVGTGDNPDVFQAQMTSSCNVTDTGLPAEVDPTPDGLSEENKPVSLSSGS